MSNKIGVNINIELGKIDKSRIFVAKNGKKYLSLTTFIDPDNAGQYGDHGMIVHDRLNEQETRPPIVGNVKVFWRDQAERQMPDKAPPLPSQDAQGMDNFDDDIPFS